MASIGIIGAGAWGTALAAHAARNDHDVTLWSREQSVVEDVVRSRENVKYLPGVRLPKLHASTDLAAVVPGAELLIFATPAQYLREVAAQVLPHLQAQTTIAIASKGMEERSLRLMTEVLSEVWPNVAKERIAMVSGPSFAREVGRGLPTDVVAASIGKHAAHTVQRLLHAPLFRIYASEDVIGVQVAGATKNVIAIAAGASDGLRFGHNALAALITRGLAEITRLGVALGARPLTFLGLAGAGDLFLTCSGDLSRNRTLGKKLAEGLDASTYLATQTSVAEGYYTARATHALARKLDVSMPISDQVYAVLHEGRPLLDAIRLLLTREIKDDE